MGICFVFNVFEIKFIMNHPSNLFNIFIIKAEEIFILFISLYLHLFPKSSKMVYYCYTNGYNCFVLVWTDIQDLGSIRGKSKQGQL